MTTDTYQAPAAAVHMEALFSRLAESVTITPKDARWVGAWWLGFLVSSCLLLLSSIPFWFLPRSLPKQGGDEGKPAPACETLDGTEDVLDNNHNLKFTEIAKGTAQQRRCCSV